jgi:hypothetical protein
MLADSQVRHRGLVQYASEEELGEVPHIRSPVRIGEGVRVRTVAPKLGQHNAEIFGRLGLSEAQMKDLPPRAYCDPAARNFALTARRCQEPTFAGPPQIAADPPRPLSIRVAGGSSCPIAAVQAPQASFRSVPVPLGQRCCVARPATADGGFWAIRRTMRQRGRSWRRVCAMFSSTYPLSRRCRDLPPYPNHPRGRRLDLFRDRAPVTLLKSPCEFGRHRRSASGGRGYLKDAGAPVSIQHKKPAD